MEDIKFLEDEPSREMLDIWLKYQKELVRENLLPSCIGEKIQVWSSNIDYYQQLHTPIEEYAGMVRDYIHQVKENDETLEEVVDKVASSHSYQFSDRDYFRILKSALSSVGSPLDFLTQLGFVNPQKAHEVLLMDESSESVDLYKNLECNFDLNNKKHKYLFMLAYNKYLLLGGEKTQQKEERINNVIVYCQSCKKIVIRYKERYDDWKRLNIFSPNDILERMIEVKNTVLLQDFGYLYKTNPSILVENIFFHYYLTYDNYTFNFTQLSKFLRTRKMKQILRLASDDCIYSNEIYEEYIRYCIQEHIEPAFQFGTLSYTSEEMFNKAPLEKNYPHFELGISYQEIKKMYEELKQRKWIDQFTSFNLFVFYFSGKCKPDNLSFILWTAPKNELAYLLTVLYKNKLLTTVPFKIAKQIFVIEGEQSIEDLNLSAIASGLSKKRKRVIDELYDIIFRTKQKL